MDLSTLIVVSHASILAVVMALVSAAKSAGLLSKWAPSLSVLLGIIGEVVFFTGTLGLAGAVFAGIVIGLLGCGLYSGVKTTAQPAAE